LLRVQRKCINNGSGRLCWCRPVLLMFDFLIRQWKGETKIRPSIDFSH